MTIKLLHASSARSTICSTYMGRSDHPVLFGAVCHMYSSSRPPKHEWRFQGVFNGTISPQKHSRSSSAPPSALSTAGAFISSGWKVPAALKSQRGQQTSYIILHCFASVTWQYWTFTMSMAFTSNTCIKHWVDSDDGQSQLAKFVCSSCGSHC